MSIEFPTRVAWSSHLQKQGLWWWTITPSRRLSSSAIFSRRNRCWCLVLSDYLPRSFQECISQAGVNLSYPEPKGFDVLHLWDLKPCFSFVPGCLCTARARGQGRRDAGGSAWSAGTSWIERRLAKCRLCSGRQSSAALARRAGRGWTSRCCTSSPRSSRGKHTRPSASPAEDKEIIGG